jgi:hypothetical protein
MIVRITVPHQIRRTVLGHQTKAKMEMTYNLLKTFFEKR